jgi:ATP-binding cassette subfamily C protein CydCD
MRPLDPRLLRHARATRGFLVLSAILGIAQTLAIIAQAVLLARILPAAFLNGAGLPSLTGELTWLAVAICLRAILAWAREVVAFRASAAVKSQLRKAVLRHLVALGPSWSASRGDGELTSLATRGIDALDAYFAKYLPQLLLAVSVPPLVIVAMAQADWLSALIIVTTLPLVPLFMALVGWTTERAQQKQWDSLQRLSRYFLDVVDGLPTLRVFGRAQAQVASVTAMTDRYRRETMKVLRISFLSSFVLELAATLSVALVAVSAGLRLNGGTVSLTTALLVLLLAPEAYLPLRQLGTNYHAAAEGMSAAGDLLDLLGIPLPARSSGLLPEIPSAGLVVENVRVTNSSRRSVILPLTSWRARSAEITAVVGPSGSGKSTLLSVLLGFTPGHDGHVLIGSPDAGVLLDEVDLVTWREQVGWVPQRPALLAGTIADNVRLGTPTATELDVRRALDRAAAAELDPDRLVGEDGTGLSAGEGQRVALARAFCRAQAGGARWLLLDEPTSHLDSVAEAQVLDSLRELATEPGRERCVVVVVHRPALAESADQVIRIGLQTPVLPVALAEPVMSGMP